MNDDDEEEDHYRNTNREPLSELLPGDHFPLKGTCSRLTLRVQQGDLVYECNYNYSLMGAQPGGFIALHPIRRRSPSPPRREASPANPNHNTEAEEDAYYCPPVRPSSMDQRPLVLFVAHQHYAESLSTTITFFPRLSVINHTGVPIRFAMFQQDPRAGPQLASHDRRLLQPWIPKETKQQMEKEPMYQPLVALTAHGRLYHQQCIPVLQCTYNSNLVMGLSLEQTTGNVLGSREVQEVVHHLREAVDHHPRMLQLYDSAGRSFYVQVNVLPRTIILSVALWVSNLTNYPLVLTESLLTRRVSAGQDSNVGIVPSQGEPFLIGCRMQEFTQVFFRIGLDGGWSSAVQVEVGSAGVFESISADGVPRSCNYVIQIPNPLEGRPIVLRITPRWVFVNTTAKKRLQIYVDCPLFSKAVRAARKDKARLAALQAMSSFPLNPGEHFVSCVGQIEGNRFSLRERLEGMLPSVTSITGEGVQHRDMTLYYEAQRTDFMSIDFPGETNVNLWAARRLRGRQTAVALGAPLEVYKPDRFDPIALEPFDPYASTESVVTGRLSITIQNKENVLTMLLGGVEATQISIQNRLLAQTVIIRQRGIRRRNTVPPCQNRFYLWEDDRSEHVLSIHIDGYKGQWFEVDFSGGDCVVSRHATPSLRHPLLNRPPPMYGANEEAMRIGYEAQLAAVHLPFYVGGFTTNHESGRIVVMITDTPVPLNATISQRRIPRHASYTLHVSFLKFVYLCEATVLAKYQHYQLAKSAAGAKARRRSHAADKKTRGESRCHCSYIGR
ncbi:hypothetical protein ADEAN_000792500 [Angomonas deanei]|uniref:Uncharacterized protein n=1 Tax=Angomonas deanei TaxID=59799 RepID=A0A7G2CMW4_9TRYP|nr:hypothetical protein ADEAN_000792500 [Angomonas deanei]